VPKPEKQDFSLKLTRIIEPKEGPGGELATLEDAARFMGHMRPWRQLRPHWEFAAELILKAAKTDAGSMWMRPGRRWCRLTSVDRCDGPALGGKRKKGPDLRPLPSTVQDTPLATDSLIRTQG
jgi:hypothetical protein